LVPAASMRRLTTCLLASLALPACSESADVAREGEIASVLARADEAQIRARPQLTAGKYSRMAGSLHAYHRGSLAVFRSDFRANHLGLAVSRFELEHPLVLGTGDPHFENYGVLVGADGELALEPNDFDSADRLPYLWDVRRLAVGMVLAAHASNPSAPAAHDATVAEERGIAAAVADGYVNALSALAQGAAPVRVTSGGDSGILTDALSRSEGDLAAREELAELTLLEGGRRRLLRGAPDPSDPSQTLADLPPNVLAALPATLARYRATLLAPPPAEDFQVLDAARVFGKGVASWARVRIFILVRGPSDAPEDDLVLELRELGDSGLGGWYPPGEYYDDVGARILATSRAAWARPDAAPLWGVSELLGLPCQIKWETEGQKTLRVARLVGLLGSASALTAAARRLGEIQARIHASGGSAGALWGRISGDTSGFVAEQAEVAVRYARQVRADHALFGSALEHLGPNLGVVAAEGDAPPPDLAALIGAPP